MVRNRRLYYLLVFLITASLACGASARESEGTDTTGAMGTPGAGVDTPGAGVSTDDGTADVTPDGTAEATEEGQMDVEGAASTVSLPEIDPFEYSGTVATTGSFALVEFAEDAARQFRSNGFSGDFDIQAAGTTAGLAQFCSSGGIPLVLASRQINDEEIAACENNGIQPLEFQFGTSGVAVVVNIKNEFVTTLTIDELAAIFSNNTSLWSDVNASWPAEPIERYAPSANSEAYKRFVAEVLDGNASAIQSIGAIEFSDDGEELIQGVLSTPYAIAIVDFTTYFQYQDALVLLPIDESELSQVSAADESYPLSQSLYIYTTQTLMEDQPQIAAYLNFLLTNVDGIINDLGIFPAPPEALQASADTWLTALGLEDFKAQATGESEEEDAENGEATPTPTPAQ